MIARRRFAFTPTLDCLSCRIAPSTAAVAVVPSTDTTTDVTSLDSSQTTAAVDPSLVDSTQTNDSGDDAPSPDDFDWTPFCAVEDYPPVNLAC